MEFQIGDLVRHRASGTKGVVNCLYDGLVDIETGFDCITQGVPVHCLEKVEGDKQERVLEWPDPPTPPENINVKEPGYDLFWKIAHIFRCNWEAIPVPDSIDASTARKCRVCGKTEAHDSYSGWREHDFENDPPTTDYY